MTSATDLLTRYLLEQADEVGRAGHAVLDGDDDGVHDLRVASRRARTVLLAHRGLLRRPDRAVADDLVTDLRQLGRDLSPARDDEVTCELVTAWARDEGWPEDATREVLRHLAPDAGNPGVAASTIALRAGSLGGALGRWVPQARWRDRAGGEPRAVLLPVVRAATRRLEDRAGVAFRHDLAMRPAGAVAQEAVDPWHEVRKAAKRVRYTAEVAAPEVPGCDDVVDQAKAVQTTLGTRHDALVLLARLRGAVEPGRPATTALLLATERARRAVAEADAGAPNDLAALREAVAAAG